ncbi:hypothetical protein BJX99DRAFT_240844 [Aspergillus californicus]
MILRNENQSHKRAPFCNDIIRVFELSIYSTMLRRSHKKSRGGCLQCKRRHVKCDERRPRCLLCTMSNRDCSFASEPPVRDRPSGPSTPSTPPKCSPASRALTPAPLSIPEKINFQHTELIIHLISTSDLLSLGDRLEPYESRIAHVLSEGLAAPYLLYALLAFSARHLAFLNADSDTELEVGKAGLYLRQATALQTQAIGLFNAEKGQVDGKNCIAVCLFSVVLGHHLFADTLNNHHRTSSLNSRVAVEVEDLESFIQRYTLCLSTHRAVYTLVLSAWDQLMGTDLAPALSRSRTFTSQSPRGNDCGHLNTLINTSQSLSSDEKEACSIAVGYLQLGFDALSPSPFPASSTSTAETETKTETEKPVLDENTNMRYQMLFLWTILVPPRFTALLAAKRPEALVILGSYARLLQFGRHLWQVGKAGGQILELLRGYFGVGSDWDKYMA